jgi:hypothetical protein
MRGCNIQRRYSCARGADPAAGSLVSRNLKFSGLSAPSLEARLCFPFWLSDSYCFIYPHPVISFHSFICIFRNLDLAAFAGTGNQYSLDLWGIGAARHTSHHQGKLLTVGAFTALPAGPCHSGVFLPTRSGMSAFWAIQTLKLLLERPMR